jgi:hypothetical protein
VCFSYQSTPDLVCFSYQSTSIYVCYIDAQNSVVCSAVCLSSETMHQYLSCYHVGIINCRQPVISVPSVMFV